MNCSKLHLTLLLCIVASLASAQQKLEGIILGASNKPLEEAVVGIPELNISSTTSSKGYFILKGDFQFPVTLAIIKPGFKQLKKVVSKQEYLKIKIEPLEFTLDEVTVETASGTTGIMKRLKNVEGTAIYASKKNDIITIKETGANLATNNARQIYAKVSGLNIWESDYAGLQLDIGGRGLNPSRSANFNTRQNNYDISADALGYPESYYSPPAAAIDQVVLIRGAASLQYGPQFGGMLNFKLKNPPEKDGFKGTVRQSYGSFNTLTSYAHLGYKKNKHGIYGFGQFKKGDGFRPNSQFNQTTGYIHYDYSFSEKTNIAAEYTHMNYLAKQAGGLTDSDFEEDPYQSIRNRNWFQVKWDLGAIKFKTELNERYLLTSNVFLLRAQRDALGYLQAPSLIDPAELTFAEEYQKNRDLIADVYYTLGNETRLLTRYNLLDRPQVLVLGARLYQSNSTLNQGEASSGSDAKFEFNDSEFPGKSQYEYQNRNVAFFAENLFSLSEKWSVTPGLRGEYINTSGDGKYRVQNRAPNGEIFFDSTYSESLSRPRTFLIAGVGTSYKLKRNVETYFNISQNYRSITFNDFRIVNPTYRVDPTLKDEKGFNADIGFRGSIASWLAYDISLFYLYYRNRIGLVQATDDNTFNVYRLRTNIGPSRTLGFESLVELQPFRKMLGEEKQLKFFVNTSFLNGKYYDTSDPSINGNKIELIPDISVKAGIQARIKNWNGGVLFSYVNDHFSDATNAFETANGTNGLIPSYHVLDINLAYTYKAFKLEASLNNALNRAYFTRRATGYPGPGIITASPRSLFLTLSYTF